MRAFAAGGIVALALLASGCHDKPPSVLLISVDSLRADSVGRIVNGQPVAPRLSALRSESLNYTRATSAAPWTTPSLMSLMTGLPAPAHGVEEHDRALAESVTTLAERFRAAGYRTAAYVPAVTLRSEYGFGRGFEIYDLENYGHTTLSAPQMAGKVLHRLELWNDEPSFIWIHFWDPHFNYTPPSPLDETFAQGERPPSDNVQVLKWTENAVTPGQARWLRGQFDGEVAYNDRAIGELLDFLRRRQRTPATIVAVLADHGESFQEHGWLAHTNRLDESLIHVPLLIHAPGRVTPAVIDTPVATASLGATLLALAGLNEAAWGVLPALPLTPSAGAPANAAGVVSQTIRQGCYTALTKGQKKYVVEQRGCSEQLFDLATDPDEQHNLAASSDLRPWRKELAEQLEALARLRIPRRRLPPEILDEARQQLISLGYVHAGTHGTTEIELDSFGDRASPPCPPAGALGCLAR